MALTSKRVVHGDDLLYRFFDEALASEPELFKRVPLLMIQSTAVWLPIDVYHDCGGGVPNPTRRPRTPDPTPQTPAAPHCNSAPSGSPSVIGPVANSNCEPSSHSGVPAAIWPYVLMTRPLVRSGSVVHR